MIGNLEQGNDFLLAGDTRIIGCAIWTILYQLLECTGASLVISTSYARDTEHIDPG